MFSSKFILLLALYRLKFHQIMHFPVSLLMLLVLISLSFCEGKMLNKLREFVLGNYSSIQYSGSVLNTT